MARGVAHVIYTVHVDHCLPLGGSHKIASISVSIRSRTVIRDRFEGLPRVGLDEAVTKLAIEAVHVSASTITREVEKTLVAIHVHAVTQTLTPHLVTCQ